MCSVWLRTQEELRRRSLELINDSLLSVFSLIIEPNFNTSSSNGSVEIHLENDSEFEEILPIVLDINEIKIISVEVYEIVSEESISRVPCESYYGDGRQTYITILNDNIREKYRGKLLRLRMDINFISRLTDTLQGFYKTSYHDDISGNVS